MKLKKNKFIIIYLSSILLLIVILVSSIPFTGYLKKISINDNQFVKDQVVINPNAKSLKIIDRMMTIKLNAEVDGSLQWDFQALKDAIEIKVGQNSIVKYEGKNLSNQTITATADFIALPEKIIPYLIKTECFCFTEQTLAPGESQVFTMVFFLDPSLDSDIDLKDIKDLVFTYRLSEYKS